MTAVAIYVAAFTLGCLAIVTDEARRNRAIDACMRRHPAWDDDTEAAIEQALAVGDDGRALADEAEAYLRGLSR